MREPDCAGSCGINALRHDSQQGRQAHFRQTGHRFLCAVKDRRCRGAPSEHRSLCYTCAPFRHDNLRAKRCPCGAGTVLVSRMEQALRLRGLTKTYPNGLTALRGIDLDVAEGDFFALLGPNGAGKSTAIGIICSLVNKTAGSVSVFGHDIQREPGAAKRCIGLVPQEFNFNVFEPVVEILVNQAGYYGIHRDEAYARAEVILRQLGLWEKRRVIPRNLSGGMKRRLMIARSLVHQPRLLILDEPTAGVDIEIRHSMWEFLRKLNADGTTIILTTHYLEEAESLCRRIAIINEGALIENTSMKQLLKQLHMETFVLDIKEPVGDLPFVAGCAAIRKIDDLTLEADVYREDSLNALFAGLGRLGIEVLTLRNKANRLEQLFMGLVGQKNGEASRQ